MRPTTTAVTTTHPTDHRGHYDLANHRQRGNHGDYQPGRTCHSGHACWHHPRKELPMNPRRTTLTAALSTAAAAAVCAALAGCSIHADATPITSVPPTGT